jgi:hypothetical protein
MEYSARAPHSRLLSTGRTDVDWWRRRSQASKRRATCATLSARRRLSFVVATACLETASSNGAHKVGQPAIQRIAVHSSLAHSHSHCERASQSTPAWSLRQSCSRAQHTRHPPTLSRMFTTARMRGSRFTFPLTERPRHFESTRTVPFPRLLCRSLVFVVIIRRSRQRCRNGAFGCDDGSVCRGHVCD